MFTKEELVLIHKAIAELNIKGSESAQISLLLNKVADQYNAQPAPAKPVKMDKK